MPTTATDRRSPTSDDAGVTLVELLVVTLLLTIVGTVVVSSVVMGLRTAQRAQDRAYAITELQRSAEELARELRMADPGATDDPFISFADDDVLVDVRRDMDGDGVSDTVRHRFVVDTGRLLHCQQVYVPPGTPCTGTPSGRTLASGLDTTTAVFALFDEDGAPTGSTADAGTVGITLVRELPDGSQAQVVTSVNLRNQ